MKRIISLALFFFIQTHIFSQSGASLKLSIDGGKPLTNKNLVTLNIAAPPTSQMMISNDANFTGGVWTPFAPTKPWSLADGDGEKTVYIKFKDPAGNTSNVISATIQLDKTPPQNPKISINKGAEITKVNSVHIELSAEEAVSILVSNKNNFAGALWKPYVETIDGWLLEGIDGPKTVFAKFQDKAGNISSVVSANITYDKTPPTGTAKINNGEAWINTPEVTLNLTTNDATEMMISTIGKEWIPFEKTKKITLPEPDGHKIVYVMLQDKAHNQSAAFKAEINLKTSPPTEGKIRIDQGHKYCVKPDKSVHLDLHAVGATHMMISNNSNFTGGVWTPYVSVVTIWKLEGEDGEKTVYAKFKDQAGNESEPCSAHIILDRSAPLGGDLSINEGALGTNNTHVKLTIKSPQDAVAMQISPYATFGEATWVKPIESMEYLLIGADGPKPIYLRFRDEAGNFSAGISKTISLDRTPPIGSTMTINGGITTYTNNPKITLQISSKDAKEMIVSSNPTFEGASWEPFSTTKTYTLSGDDGPKVLGAKFKDNAGNISAPITAKIILSTKPPQDPKIAIDVAGEYCTNPNRMVNLKLHAVHASQMMVSNMADFAGSTWVTYTPVKPSWILAPGEGEKTVYAKFITGAGIESQVVSAKIKLDITPPTKGSIKLNNGAKGTNDKEGKIKVEISAVDATEMMLTDNGIFTDKKWQPYATALDWTLIGADGMKNIAVKFKDKAGNISTPVSANIMLDRTPPSGTFVINEGQNATTTTTVRLKINPIEATEMQISNSSSFGELPWEKVNGLHNWTLETGDGVKTVFMRFRDNANNMSTVSSDNIELDTKAPSQGTILVNDGAKLGAKSTVQLKVQSEGAKFMKISNRADFIGSNWIPYSDAPKPWDLLPGEGERKVSVKFKDDAGNETEAVSAIIAIDYTPPAAGKILVDNGEKYSKTKDHNVKLDISSTGADEMMISNNSTFAGGVWEPYATTKQWQTTEGDGKKVVYVKFRDKTGNESTPVFDDIEVDTEF